MNNKKDRTSTQEDSKYQANGFETSIETSTGPDDIIETDVDDESTDDKEETQKEL